MRRDGGPAPRGPVGSVVVAALKDRERGGTVAIKAIHLALVRVPLEDLDEIVHDSPHPRGTRKIRMNHEEDVADAENAWRQPSESALRIGDDAGEHREAHSEDGGVEPLPGRATRACAARPCRG